MTYVAFKWLQRTGSVHLFYYHNYTLNMLLSLYCQCLCNTYINVVNCEIIIQSKFEKPDKHFIHRYEYDKYTQSVPGNRFIFSEYILC
jgi:hypothetical protein